MAHAFDDHNASLSEGAPLAAVVGALPGKPYWKRVGRIPRVGCDKAKRGCASRVPASSGAPHEMGDGGESDPPFFGAGAPPGRGKWATLKATIYPHLRRVALTSVIPGGKASRAFSRSRWMSVSACNFVT